MRPVVHVLVQEFRLGRVHTVDTNSIKVPLDLTDRACHDVVPVVAAHEAFAASIR